MYRFCFRLTFIILFSLLSRAANSQNCFSTGLNGSTINLPCNVTCTTLQVKVPHLKSSEDYIVSSIPYNPYPYTVPTAPALVLPCTNQDDKFFDTTFLPFPFCFYGASYSKMVISTNGLVTFDTTNALRGSHWSFTSANQIPSAGSGTPTASTNCPTPGGTLFPRASIMGPYHDIDIDVNSPNKKMEYRVEGTAPCRRLIISYNEIALFGCSQDLQTHQIVMYESTGFIEVYVKDKDICTHNGGLAILGIQNWERDKAVWAPGKNSTQWTATNEAYRFSPAGATTRFKKAELYSLAGTLLHTTTATDTATTVAGMLDITFPNTICPTSGNNQYVIKTYYSSCSDVVTEMIATDTVNIVTSNSLGATATTTAAACGPNGSITLNIPTGAGTLPYTLTLDGTQTSTTSNQTTTYSNLIAGAHTIQISTAGGCSQLLNVTIPTSGTLTVTPVVTATSCNGAANGSITLQPQNGVAPFFYSLNNGPIQLSPTFSNLVPGTYNIRIADAGGCLLNPLVVTVVAGNVLPAQVSALPPSCAGASNGSITVTATGIPPYQYSLNGGPYQSSNTFTNLSTGPYFVTVKDAVNCTSANINANVPPSSGSLQAQITGAPTSCAGVNNGSITITPQSGSGPYQYSVNGGAFVTGTQLTGLAPAVYVISVRDAAGCTSQPQPITITAGAPLSATVTPTAVVCNGGSTGSALVQLSGNPVAPLQYSLDNTVFQASNQLVNLPAGTHTVYFNDASGCSGNQTFVITQPAAITATNTITPVSCNGLSDGIFSISATGGTAPLSYSVNGTNFQASPQFNLPAGTYSVRIRDDNNCSFILPNQVITQPSVLAGTFTTGAASCAGGADGNITLTPSGGTAPYQYALNGGNYSSGNTFNSGTGTFSAAIRDNNGCIINLSNIVVALNNNLVLTMPAPVSFCESKSAGIDPVSNATAYSWSPAQGLSNSTIRNPIASPTVTTTYTLSASLGVCNTTQTYTVTVNPAPIADAGAGGTVCKGQSFGLSGSGGVVYEWSPSATIISGNTTSSPVVQPDKTTQYSVFVTDALGCRSLAADQVTVNVTPPFKVVVNPPDTVAYLGDTIRLNASSIGTSYTWSPVTGLSDPYSANPYLVVTQNEIYTVTATTDAGCTGSTTFRLQAFQGPDIYVPNAFTPNGDGKNDLLRPFPVGIAGLKYFKVFNRWGQEVYSWKGTERGPEVYNLQLRTDIGWNGKIDGMAQGTQTFVWLAEGVTKEGKVISRKGSVTLIR